jgi:hypothetical protein
VGIIETIKKNEACRIPLGRRGEPAEVAAWIRRFADPAATLADRLGPDHRRWPRTDLTRRQA